MVIEAGDGRIRWSNRSPARCVAEHALVAPGETSILDEHYGGPRPDRPRRAVRPRTATEKQFLALGPAAEAFLPAPPRPG